MAKMGIKCLVANTPEAALDQRLEMFQKANADHGRNLKLGEDVALGYRIFIAETEAKAIEQARPYYEEAMKFAAPLGLTALNQEQIAAVSGSGLRRGVQLPTLEEASASKAWLCGPPEAIISHLKGVEQKYPGAQRINLGSVMGMPLDVFKDQLTKFAEGVMPAFQG